MAYTYHEIGCSHERNGTRFAADPTRLGSTDLTDGIGIRTEGLPHYLEEIRSAERWEQCLRTNDGVMPTSTR